MRKPDYAKIAEPGSFIDDYMALFVNTETATAYDFWCAVWLTSNALGRNIIVPRPNAPVFLNEYIILCADAGITRKSTALRNAYTFFADYVRQHSPHTPILTGGVAPQKLDETLASLSLHGHDAHVAICVSELVSFLGRDRYSLGMPGKLTDLYDCPDSTRRETVTHGVVEAKNIYVTFIAASTPSWLMRAVNPSVVEGGFTSRCLFIIEEEPKKLVAWPDDIDRRLSDSRRQGVISRLHRLAKQSCEVANRHGGIKPTSSAIAHFQRWYQSRKLSTDAFTASFQSREDHHILRLAAILAASDGTWEIRVTHLDHAINVIGWIREQGSVLFGSGLQSTRMYSLVDRLRQILMQAGRSGLSQTTVTQLTRRYGSVADVNTALAVMHEMHLVQRFEVKTGERGRPVIMWRGTKALITPSSAEQVVEFLSPPMEAT